MTYIQQLTGRTTRVGLQIMAMAFGFTMLLLQSSPVQAQWTTGTNINNTNSGNVGIGTTAPTEKLEVNGTVKSSGLTVTGAPAQPSYVNALYLGMSGTTATIDAVNQNVDFRDLVITNKTFQVKSWTGGGLVTGLFQNTAGNVGIGTTTPNKSSVSGRAFTVNGSPDAVYELAIGDVRKGTVYHDGTELSLNNNVSGPVVLRTNNTERFRIDSSGNVGIGTTSPASLLQVGSSSSAGNQYLSLDAGAGYQSAIDFRSGGTQKWVIYRPASSADLRFYDGADRLVLQSGGNVGIGISAPTAKLHVVGDGRFTGNLTVDGSLAAKYQDVAEWVESSQALPAGTVVVLDETKSNQVIASSRVYDTRVAGVISARPGITLGENGAGKVLVATTGRVRIKVDASLGAIQVGDLLVTSALPGFAMKSQPIDVGGVQIHRPGTLVGKALEPLASGTGEILVLLSLQ